MQHDKIQLLLVGHYTHDVLNKNEETPIQRLGGGVAYASVVAKAFKQNFKVISKVGHDFYYDKECQQPPLVISHKKTTSFINYTCEIPRRHLVNARCEPIYPDDIQDTCHIAILCSVIGDVLPATIQKMREKSDVLIGDIQGMTRQVDASGAVSHIHIDETDYKDILPLFDYIKVSDEELPYINFSVILKHTTLLLTYGDNGCTVFQKDRQFHVPGCPVTAIDSTGAGDSFLTGFAMGILEKLSVPEAVSLGCCCGRVAVQAIGTPMIGAFHDSAYVCVKSCEQCMLKRIEPMFTGTVAV